MASEEEKIPDWAALSAIVGMALAAVSLVAVLLGYASDFSSILLTIGLIILAVGMHAAERAIDG